MKIIKFVRHKIKAFTRKFIKALPEVVRGRIIRLQFQISLPEGVFEHIQYKVADSRDEIEEAFELVQGSYLETKLTTNGQRNMRLSKFNALPTTTIFIAKYQGEVIATVSQIMDTGLGLPIDSFSNLEELRRTGKRISEISSLAVKKSWRSQSEGVFFPLTAFAFNYCRDQIGVDYLAIVTRASVRFFYTSIYGFKPLDSEIKCYSKVNNNPSFSQYIDLNNMNSFLRKNYKSKKLHKNLYLINKYFPWSKQCRIERKNYPISTDPVLKLDDLDYFFNVRTNLFPELSESDVKIIKSIYYYENYTQVISPGQSEFANRRSSPRFQVNMKLEYSFNEELFDAKILEVSDGGFAVVFSEGSIGPETLHGSVNLNKEESCRFIAKKCWGKGTRCGYFFLKLETENWSNMINYSKNHVNQKLTKGTKVAA